MSSVKFEFCDEVTGRKLTSFRLLKLQRRIFIASVALFYFATNTWQFKNDKMLWLRDRMHSSDKEEFGFDGVEEFDNKEFFMNATKAASVYLLKEPADKTHARKHYAR